MGEPPRPSGCWIHCYSDDAGKGGKYFIVHESAGGGRLSLSSRMVIAAEDAERLLVDSGADPGEAHVRVEEAIVRGTAFLTFG